MGRLKQNNVYTSIEKAQNFHKTWLKKDYWGVSCGNTNRNKTVVKSQFLQ